MGFDFIYIYQHIPMLMNGLAMTLIVTVIALFCSLFIGMLGAICRTLSIPIISGIVKWYIEVIRNTPILAQLFFIYYGLPSIGIQLSSFWSGIICLSLWAGAYQVENFRGGLITVHHGIKEAAIALDLSRLHYFIYIALPIALKSCLPAVLNTAISMLKNSSYLQTIGFAELTYVAVDRISLDFKAFEMFAAIAVIYIALVLILVFIGRRLEMRLNRGAR
ncbi:amino acid ABC transporter permease [Brenneria goodwinii]|uniref:amino acid ABC transporter permease n=1 Tax=Brenneria goodwinii TaxID=1109412 RepID=UPI0036E74AA3